MNAPQSAASVLASTNGGGNHVNLGSALGSPTSQKRSQYAAGIDSSPGSIEEGEDGDGDGDEGRKRLPGVKRACNQCRQQKLRCDVIQEPFTECSRCRRLKLECKIDTNFKRIGKRSKNAEMEKEIVELRRQLASQHSSPTIKQEISVGAPLNVPESSSMAQIPTTLDQYMGSQDAVASLLDLKSGLEGGSHMRSPNGQIVPPKRIGEVVLSLDRIQDLFHHFFSHYRPFSSLLDLETPFDHYYDACPLLFWTIIAVAARRYGPDPNLLTSLSSPLSRLLWSTLADVPQDYHVVKALCLLCTWPLPISSTSADPTFMLSGVMMHVAMQIGLHRPSHAHDFSRFKVELREEELKDRAKTWAAVLVVGQRVATGYGQPPSSLYDWTLASSGSSEKGYRLPDQVEARVLIERFCNKVTKAFYCSPLDSVGLATEKERSTLTKLLAQDYEELGDKIRPTLASINIIYLRAAGFHLRLSVLFDSPVSKDYREGLLALWVSTTSFLESAFGFETSGGESLTYATNYLLQIIIAAGFTLLKLLNSSFAIYVDLDYGRSLFNRTIWTIRNISVATNDLPSRLAEVLVQLWRGGGAGSRVPTNDEVSTDNSLQLKVRCRMSMSLVYDSVWRWREDFQAKGRGNLDTAIRNPTNPESAAESSASSALESSLAPPGLVGGMITPGPSSSYGESNYEVFDPLNWMLDGLVDFPYSLAGQGLETQSMM